MNTQRLLTYELHDVAPYINWIYFFHAWGFQPRYATISHIHNCHSCRNAWIKSFADEEQSKACESIKLFDEANTMINELDTKYKTQAIVRLCEAYSENDDIIIANTKHKIPCLRQQHSIGNTPNECLADLVTYRHDETTTVGIFAAAADNAIESLFPDDTFRHLLAQTIADRLAEATAEKMHEEVRKTIWAYAPDESLTMQQLHNEEFQGIRPAIGYPSLPDQSLNFVIDELIDMKQIGIKLTENGAMIPHAATSGLIFSHPKARYFSIGRIGKDQLADYASRRGMNIERMKHFLAGNL